MNDYNHFMSITLSYFDVSNAFFNEHWNI